MDVFKSLTSNQHIDGSGGTLAEGGFADPRSFNFIPHLVSELGWLKAGLSSVRWGKGRLRKGGRCILGRSPWEPRAWEWIPFPLLMLSTPWNVCGTPAPGLCFFHGEDPTLLGPFDVM